MWEGQRSRLMRTAKEETAGERILGPTRRPDGTLRKPIRIRAGYVPQDEVAIYQSKGVLLKKAQPDVPPGFDAEAVSESNNPKTRSAKRNGRKKEKKLQPAVASSDGKGKDLFSEQSGKLKSEDTPFAEKQHRLETVETVTNQISNLSVSTTSEVTDASTDQIETSKCEDTCPDIDKRIRALKKQTAVASSDGKGKDLDSEQSGRLKSEDIPFTEKQHRLETVETVTNQISSLSVSSTSEVTGASTDQIETSKCEDTGPGIDKRIRALKKKIRLTDAQLKGDRKTSKPEQLEKIAKVEGWRGEVKFLEDKKATMVS